MQAVGGMQEVVHVHVRPGCHPRLWLRGFKFAVWWCKVPYCSAIRDVHAAIVVRTPYSCEDASIRKWLELAFRARLTGAIFILAISLNLESAYNGHLAVRQSNGLKLI